MLVWANLYFTQLTILRIQYVPQNIVLFVENRTDFIDAINILTGESATMYNLQKSFHSVFRVKKLGPPKLYYVEYGSTSKHECAIFQARRFNISLCMLCLYMYNLHKSSDWYTYSMICLLVIKWTADTKINKRTHVDNKCCIF